MKMRHTSVPFSLFLDFFLLVPILTFATWVYLIPPFQTFGYHALFSDDAIFATMARKVLEEGPSGAFHLAWGPLLPWLIAILNKFFNIPLDEGGRIITGISLTLRIIPLYFLLRILLNRVSGLLISFLVTIYPILLIPQEATLAEGLYTLTLSGGLLFSLLALKTEKSIWYLFSGSLWGLTYLARLEGWIFLVPPLLLIIIKFLHFPKSRFLALKLITIYIFAFLVISSPFLFFVKQTFGSWTLSPRANVALTVPGNPFTFYKDQGKVTTAAQIYFSGDPQYYNSTLWHPTPFAFWRSVGRSWPTLTIIPYIYLKFFREQLPVILTGAVLGLLLTFYLIFRQKWHLVIYLLAILGFTFATLDFSLTTLEFTSPIIFNPRGDIFLFLDQFYRMFSTKGYPEPLMRDFIILTISSLWLITRRKNYGQLLKLFYQERLKWYLPLTLFFGFIPLFFNNFSNKYAVATGLILSLITILFLSQILSILKTHISQKLIAGTVYILILSIFFWLNLLQIYHALDIRETQYKVQDFQINYLKKPGLVILKDHGPRAKVGVFHEAPAFYAQGTSFYFVADGNITLEQTLKYFEDNNVDYFVANKFQAFYTWKQLRPLMLPTTKLKNWEIIYSDPPAEQQFVVSESDTDMLVTVWKRVN